MNYDPIHDTYAAPERDGLDGRADEKSSPVQLGIQASIEKTTSTRETKNGQATQTTLGSLNSQPSSQQNSQPRTSPSVQQSVQQVQYSVQSSVQQVQSSAQQDQSSQTQTLPLISQTPLVQATDVSNISTQPEAEGSDEDDSESDQEPGTLPPHFRQTSRGFKHLKKADGEPFWRKDIQYDFLHELFTDENRVFTNNFPFCEVPNAANGPKLTFAELYVRTLAESLKLSKVLRERLIKDSDMGIAVSKVCLLVNAGRMNTTVNFVPDMRSALRTYHLIPSLQATPEGPPRPLQDTPRLKTILKAVCDGQDHLQTLLDLLKAPPAQRPNTNVIKLIFLMSTFFQNIPFHYDDSYVHDSFSEKLRFIKASPGPQNKFMEFFLNDEICPKNRSRRFLWLVYTYLETSFSQPELATNPFNPHLIPPIEYVPEAELARFDNDTDYEIEYAIRMYHTRMMHLNDEVNNTNPKRGNKSKRERQKIRKQLILEHNYRPLPDGVPEEDTADDLAMIDDSHHDNHDSDEHENPEEARQGYHNRVILDRGVKRKKPAPSVGSLVEETRRLVEPSKLSPEFPIDGLEALRRRYSVCTTDVPVHPLTRESVLSVARRKSTIVKSKSLVGQVARASPHKFDLRRAELLEWMYRYFQYRKSAGNGLLAMEWEDIRSDVVHGVEAYLYQQKGKTLVIHRHEEQMEDEYHESGEPELLKRENFVTGSDPLPGDLAPVDVGNIEKVGAGYVALHDFNNANERNTYEYLLLTMVDTVIAQNQVMRRSQPQRILFNLNSGSVSFA